MGGLVRLVKKQLASLAAAFQLLTRIPVPIAVPYDASTLGRSIVYYPLCGAFIGAMTCGAAYVLLQWLPPMPSAVLVLAIWIALSGGLHLDGWMDTADGVLSHRNRERMLAIMKDSRVGAMGVLAGVLLLLLKYALLVSLFEKGLSAVLVIALICIPVWSRWWMGSSIVLFRYSRESEENGMGHPVKQGAKPHHASGALGVALLVTFMVFWCIVSAVPAAVIIGLPAAAALAGLPFTLYIAGKLGGLTGDTYGAINEWVEAWLLLLVVIFIYG